MRWAACAFQIGDNMRAMENMQIVWITSHKDYIQTGSFKSKFLSSESVMMDFKSTLSQLTKKVKNYDIKRVDIIIDFLWLIFIVTRTDVCCDSKNKN